MTKATRGIAVKRVYEPPDDADGLRVLVDRLWPRGIARERAKIDLWLKELSPSHALRRWYGHDPALWREFRKRYVAELAGQGEALARLRDEAAKRRVTLLFGTREMQNNNAVALAAILGRKSPSPVRPIVGRMSKKKNIS